MSRPPSNTKVDMCFFLFLQLIRMIAFGVSMQFAVLFGSIGWLMSRDVKRNQLFYTAENFVIKTQLEFRWIRKKCNSNIIVNTKVVCIEATFLADLAVVILVWVEVRTLFITRWSGYSIFFLMNLHLRFIEIHMERRQKNE